MVSESRMPFMSPPPMTYCGSSSQAIRQRMNW